MGKQNLDKKEMYLRELSGSKFHSVTSCNVIVYKLNFHHKWIYQVLEMSSSIIIVMAQQNHFTTIKRIHGRVLSKKRVNMFTL